MRESQSVKTLVVEDDPGLLETIRDGFTSFGFNVVTAVNGEDAWGTANQEKPDVVVSDIRMPKMNGIQLLERLKNKNPRSPRVILVSAYSDFSVDELMNMGADAVFQKPFRAQVIRDTIQRAALEPKDRWAKKPNQKISGLYEKTIEELHVALKAGIISFGRGGIFFEQSESFPEVGDYVEFKVHIGEGYPCEVVHGIGRVPWVRRAQQGELLAGFGVELEYLFDSCRERYTSWLKITRILAFIPNR